MDGQDSHEKRDGERVDRRKRPTPLFNKYFLWGRRRGPRRSDEHPSYVDRPPAKAMLWLSFLIILGVIDIFLTDYEINAGLATEGNPFMEWLLIVMGSRAAWMLKIIMTIFGGWLLLAHALWRSAYVGMLVLNIYYFWIFVIHVTLLIGTA